MFKKLKIINFTTFVMSIFIRLFHMLELTFYLFS